MRKILGPLIVAVFLLSCTLPASSVQAAAARATLLSATVTGNGTALNVDMSFVNGFQVVITGAPSAAVVTLKASNDGVTFSTIGTFDLASDSSGDIVIPEQAKVQWIRADLDTLTGGTAPTVTVRAIYSDQASSSAVGGGGGGTTPPSDFADCTVGLTTGGTAQNIVTADVDNVRIELWNQVTETEPVYVRAGATAVIPVAQTSGGASLPIMPGGFLSLDLPQALESISVIAATTGHQIGCAVYVE